MNNWFLVKVKYTKHLENGNLKRVTEQYLLEAMSFTDAEARIYDELGASIQGEFIVGGINIADIHDVFMTGDCGEYYKCKISYELLGDDAENAKALTQNFLIEANSVIEAYERLVSFLKELIKEFTVTAITKTNIMDIFVFVNDNASEQSMEEENMEEES